jgi:FMN phosphatase YigB (HAD superfamily)
MGQPKEKEVIIVGDSLTSDIAGGINFGIDTCWFNPKRVQNCSDFKVSLEVSDLSELVNIMNDT